MFVGGGAWEAHVVAADPQRDLAALQMTAADLPYLPLGVGILRGRSRLSDALDALARSQLAQLLPRQLEEQRYDEAGARRVP